MCSEYVSDVVFCMLPVVQCNITIRRLQGCNITMRYVAASATAVILTQYFVVL